MALTGFADLHTHTNASDGTSAPADNVRIAKEAGLAAIAITDHDTMAGVSEALEEGGRLGIAVVPGVELSTSAEERDIHILGYYADMGDARWMERLRSLRDVRGTRNRMIVDRLQELGLSIGMDDVLRAAGERSDGSATVGRPHIAQALLSAGHVSTIAEAFDRYLGEGAAAYVNPPRLSPFAAIDWIREAGGRSVIAHPGLYGNDRLVEELLRHGANGIEAHHPDHHAEDERRYAEMAARYGVIATGGSDYHGVRNGIIYHGNIGCRTVSASIVEWLKPAR